jgi:branched-chain amino acid transport system ATP-binding protein
MSLLELKNVSIRYNMIQALSDVSIHVDEGEIVTIIGANGAGKSSTMNAITGLVRIASGEIVLDGKPLPSAAHNVTRAGIALAPEGRRIFGPLTVRENLMIGAYLRSDKTAVVEDCEKVFGIFPRLKERINQPSSTLSGGEQQMLAIGRSMMSRPRLLLLDEPSLGLAPLLIEEIFQTIRRLNEGGTTILLVEQNAQQALALADRAYVYQTGKVIREGKARELLHDPQIEAAYLGVRRAEAANG